MFTEEKKKLDPKEYEQVKVNALLPTTIHEVQYDISHSFKGYEGKPGSTQPAVRFKFAIEGMKFHKYSRWMKILSGEKSNLYTKYLVPLVAGIKPDAKFDIDHLKGMKVQTLWTQDGDFQNMSIIVPALGMIEYTDQPAVPESDQPPF